MSAAPAQAAGRTALVTGASRGIGFAIARALVEGGVRVLMVARDPRRLTEAAGLVGGEACPADVSSADEVKGLGETALRLLGGPPDFVVNAAGTFALAPLVDTSVETFDAQLAANLRGPFLVVRALLPAMLARGSGHIVNIGSVAGRAAYPGNAAYSASKFGLRGLHEVLAQEVQGSGVRATLVEPAATDTPLWDPLDPDARADLPSRAAMLRPEDVARAVVFALMQPSTVEIPVLAIRASG